VFFRLETCVWSTLFSSCMMGVGVGRASSLRRAIAVNVGASTVQSIQMVVDVSSGSMGGGFAVTVMKWMLVTIPPLGIVVVVVAVTVGECVGKA
jgi:hypothetical protein